MLGRRRYDIYLLENSLEFSWCALSCLHLPISKGETPKIVVAGAGFEPRDLRVMSPTSYLAAPPRDKSFQKLYYFIR